jgi:hypothetical protein
MSIAQEATKAMTGTTTTTITARQLAPFIKGIRYQEVAMDCLDRHVVYGDLPFCVRTAVQGIAWARQTGRLSSKAAAALAGLRGSKLAALVAAVANECTVMGEVPRYLNSRLG